MEPTERYPEDEKQFRRAEPENEASGITAASRGAIALSIAAIDASRKWQVKNSENRRGFLPIAPEMGNPHAILMQFDVEQ